MTRIPARPRYLTPILVALATTLLAQQARATWSIVVFNRRTREVAVASATCLNTIDLENVLPVVIVGIGGAAAQSAIDIGAENRQIIHAELLAGTPPEMILELLEQLDGQHRQRQYGIVDGSNLPGTFTGESAGSWAGGVRGEVGDLSYAIQGNVITGPPVVLKAEEVLVGTDGDLAEKVMAAMEMAMEMGGDGRCSCDLPGADDCGSPPDSFAKSAHIAFFVLTRLGDRDGRCGPGGGCARGDYYLNLNFPFQADSRPDPIRQMRKRFEDWRLELFGRPDHVKTRRGFDVSSLPADGVSETTLHLETRDHLDRPLGFGGLNVEVRHAEQSAGSTTILGFTDNGDGTYDVQLRAGNETGRDVFEVVLGDGVGRDVTLIPLPTLDSVSPPLGPRRPALWRLR